MGKDLLFVDDRSKRIHYALSNFHPLYYVTIAPNVPEALRLISSRPWNVISLDYDLNGYDFQDIEEKTCGMEIVRYIGKMGWPHVYPKPIFWLHSSNAFGARVMYESLRGLGFMAEIRPIHYEEEVKSEV